LNKWHIRGIQAPLIAYNKDIRGRETNPTKHSLNSLIMRKIEQQMNAALANSKNWQSGNTSVHYNEENNTSVVRLHGNKIAVLGDDFLEIFDGGWQTTTTKSRLNAIINEFCNGVTDGVFQKNYEWFVRDNNVTKEFTNGYIFA
jgi:hypothetical protein